MLQWQFIIFLSTVKTIEKQQAVSGIITEMTLIIFLPPSIMQTSQQILHHLNTKQVLQEKHQMQIKKIVKTLSRIIQRLKNNLEIVVPLKNLSNLWRNLDMPLINCEVSLTLTWLKIVF